MTWTGYQVSFRLLAPVHIGWRKLGNLQQTRPYVTGRSLWGALTARLTRELVSQPDSKDYEEIGKQVDQQLAFTYFYPSISPDPTQLKLWPWPDKQWDEFAWTFLGSYASTALENGRSAEAGSLHETEFIAPYIRNYIPDKKPEPVFLVGYIFENNIIDGDKKAVNNWKSMLDKLQFGGERSYGWGSVSKGILKELNSKRCFDYEVIDTEDHVLLKALKSSQLLAHTIFTDTDLGDDLSGRGVAVEPFIGRETGDNDGFGKNFSKLKVCWVPGGEVKEGETFQILEKGIWKRYP